MYKIISVCIIIITSLINNIIMTSCLRIRSQTWSSVLSCCKIGEGDEKKDEIRDIRDGPPSSHFCSSWFCNSPESAKWWTAIEDRRRFLGRIDVQVHVSTLIESIEINFGRETVMDVSIQRTCDAVRYIMMGGENGTDMLRLCLATTLGAYPTLKYALPEFITFVFFKACHYLALIDRGKVCRSRCMICHQCFNSWTIPPHKHMANKV